MGTSGSRGCPCHLSSCISCPKFSIMRAQEVQSNHFSDFLQPELARAGYTAIYKKKTMEIYTGNAYAIDGCATFFKKERFALVKKYEVGLCALPCARHEC